MKIILQIFCHKKINLSTGNDKLFCRKFKKLAETQAENIFVEEFCKCWN